jgi:sugar O-acyltransferase (sialic acid O-acetyltransferase NeuD family)
MTAYVLGAGGHARVVIATLLARGNTVQGVTDRTPSLRGTLIEGVPVVGTDDDLISSLADGDMLYVGLGNVARLQDSGLSPRRKLFERFRNLGYGLPPLVALNSFVAASATLESGAQVMAGAAVQAGAWIGENTLVNTGAIVEHDCRIGGHSHVAPGAIVCGGVSVGKECHIGAGAVVLQGLNLVAGTVVPAGAVMRRGSA